MGPRRGAGACEAMHRPCGESSARVDGADIRELEEVDAQFVEMEEGGWAPPNALLPCGDGTLYIAAVGVLCGRRLVGLPCFGWRARGQRRSLSSVARASCTRHCQEIAGITDEIGRAGASPLRATPCPGSPPTAARRRRSAQRLAIENSECIHVLRVILEDVQGCIQSSLVE